MAQLLHQLLDTEPGGASGGLAEGLAWGGRLVIGLMECSPAFPT